MNAVGDALSQQLAQQLAQQTAEDQKKAAQTNSLGLDDSIGKLKATMDRSLAQQAAMQAMTIDFQTRTEGLKAVSEAMNAGHEAKMDTLDKVGRASG